MLANTAYIGEDAKICIKCYSLFLQLSVKLQREKFSIQPLYPKLFSHFSTDTSEQQGNTKHSWVKFLIWRPTCLLKLRDLAPDTIKAVVVALHVYTVSFFLLETAFIVYGLLDMCLRTSCCLMMDR